MKSMAQFSSNILRLFISMAQFSSNILRLFIIQGRIYHLSEIFATNEKHEN